MRKYTLKEIENINKGNLAINDRFYEDVDGYVYIGKGKRLFKYAKCSEVSIDNPDLQSLGSNVCEVLSNLDDRIEVIEEDYVTQEELKKVKCFAISAAITYG